MSVVSISRSKIGRVLPILCPHWSLAILIPVLRYPYNQYGSIVWDTHTYTGGSSNLDEVLGFYDWDLGQIQDFQNRQSAPMIIGEFAFSNLK